MASRSQKRLFEELGLPGTPELPNPYETLGLNPDFARRLLALDDNGETLKTVTTGLFRALTRTFHPDNPGTGNAERNREITEARERIEKASGAALLRWSKVEQASSFTKTQKAQVERQQIAYRATELLRTTMELGRNPLHYSQLENSQGLLLNRGDSTLLLRQKPERGLRVSPGRPLDLSTAERALGLKSQVFDFQRFMQRHDSFGLEPGTKIATFLDENGRTSILTPDLTFLMDITDPVADMRQQRSKLTRHERQHRGVSDSWGRAKDPVLFISEVPSESEPKDSAAQIITFPRWIGEEPSGHSLAWDIPMEAIGSISDKTFFSRARHDRTIASLVLESGEKQTTMNHFNLLGVPTSRIIEQDLGYTPLLTPGNTLMFYDESNHIPVVTDVQIIGLLGSNATAA